MVAPLPPKRLSAIPRAFIAFAAFVGGAGFGASLSTTPIAWGGVLAALVFGGLAVLANQVKAD